MLEVFKIGIEMELAGGLMNALELVAKKLTGLKTTVDDVGGSFAHWGAALGAAGIAGMLDVLISKGETFQHQIELLKTSGIDAIEIQADRQVAFQVAAAVQTTTVAENLQHLRELTIAFGTPEAAREHLEEVAKSNAVLGSVMSKSGHPEAVDQVWQIVKSLEEKGETIDPDSFRSYLDMMTRVVEASGGKVTPQQFFSTFKYARTAKYDWDQDFVQDYLPRLIQEYMGSSGGGGSGAGGPGNALMSSFAKVVQGQMPKKAAEEFINMGLVDATKGVGDAGFQATLGGTVLGRDEFMHNPYKWVQDFLVPALAKHGITSQEDITAEISKLFPVRTASDIMTNMALFGSALQGDKSQFEKDAHLAQQAMPLEKSYQELAAHDPTMVMQKFEAQWTSMLQALGTPLVEPALATMNKITNLFTSVTQFAGAHPEAIKLIGEALAGLAAGFAVFATGATLAGLIAFAPAGAAVAGIAGLATAVGVFASLNWEWASQLVQHADDMKNAADAWAAIKWTEASNALHGFVNDLNWFVDQIKGIAAKIEGFFSHATPNAPLVPGHPNTDLLPANPQGVAPQSNPVLPGFHMPGFQKSDYEVPEGWSPPSNGGQMVAISLPTTLAIDGRKIAETISEQLAMLFAMPSSAPFSGAGGGYLSPDSGMTST